MLQTGRDDCIGAEVQRCGPRGHPMFHGELHGNAGRINYSSQYIITDQFSDRFLMEEQIKYYF